MLRRNKVPTLKMMCIRKIAFPATAEYHFRIASKELQERRETKNLPYHKKRQYFSERADFFRALHLKYAAKKEMSYGDVSSSMESIVNGWIRLSAYYETSLEEWHDIGHFFGPQTISTLDFLHEGALLRSGLDFRKYARFIPNTNSPQYVEPLVYKELLDILNETHNTETLKNLYISFAFPPLKLAHVPGAKSFEFERTFRLVNLSKLVVHGPAADNSLLSAVGFWCKSLKYLDIRGTAVTEQGILLLLLKQPKKDAKKFEIVPEYPHIPELLTDLTKTLEYLDMSTVRRRGGLLRQDKIVRMALPRLRGTLGRVFFLPEGKHFLTCRDANATDEKLRSRVLKNAVFSFLRGKIFDAFVRMVGEMHCRLHFNESVTGMEIRRDAVDDENVILFLHEYLVVMEFRLTNLNIVTILCHTKSSLNFLPIELLSRVMPHLREIKASLEGFLLASDSFRKLERLTIPMVKSKQTLTSILKKARRLVYVEVGEMLHSSDGATLDDGDIGDIFHPSGDSAHVFLEVFRLHFQNQVTLSPGLRDLVKFCPELRIVGDLSCWRISYSSLLDFSAQLSYHNCDIIYEYKNLLYHTATPCKEFFR